MATILETLGSALTPDVIGKLGQALGVDSNLVDKGLRAVGPLTMGSLDKTVSTKAGAESIMGMLPKDPKGGSEGIADIASSLLGSVMGGAQGGTGADLLNGILGQGVGAISGTLNQKLGFDVKPLLTMALPVIMGMLSKRAKDNNLDATGVTKLVHEETKAYMDNPANKEMSSLVQAALKAGDEAVELRKNFTDAEWQRVRMAPVAALYRVATASPSGSGGSMLELKAAVETVGGALNTVSPTSLLGAAFGTGLTQADVDILKRDAPPNSQLMNGIRDAMALVSSKSPKDAQAYGDMVIAVANNVANAAKEGGFLGIGGKQVTAEEAAAVAEIRAAVGR